MQYSCKQDETGAGPRFVISKLLEIAGIDLKEVGLFDIDEAFASQLFHQQYP